MATPVPASLSHPIPQWKKWSQWYWCFVKESNVWWVRPHSVCTCWPLPFPYFGSPMTGGDDDLNHEDYGNICCPLFQRRSLPLCKLTVEQWQHAFIYFMRSWGVVYANIAEDHVCCSWRGKADGRHWWGTEAGPKHNAPRCVNLLIIKVKPIQAINISFVWPYFILVTTITTAGCVKKFSQV